MKVIINKLSILFLFYLGINSVFSQKTTDNYRVLLDSLSKKQIPALNSEVNISVNQVRIDEFIRALGKDVNLNLSIPVGVDLVVTNNFTNVKAKDVLIFLCEEYQMHMDVIGNIVKLRLLEQMPLPSPTPKVKYNKNTKSLSYDLRVEQLACVARTITDSSAYNLILAPGLEDMYVNGYVKDMPFQKALQQLAFSNNLKLRKEDESFYVLEALLPQKQSVNGVESQRSVVRKSELIISKDINIEIKNKDSISISVDNYPIQNLFPFVASKLKYKYAILDPLNGSVSLHLKNVSWEKFLYHLFKGGESTYRYQDDVCFVGSRSNLGLKNTELIPLQFRSVSKLIEVFPQDLVRGLEVKEFLELNSFVVMGDADRIYEFIDFIKEVDRMVPVVLIDVIIVEFSDNHSLETGIEMGLNDESEKTKGTIMSGVDMTLNSSSVNNMMSDIGLTKLGKVTPNFYIKLKALETDGKADIRSTPRLSTLNGHEATLVIGQTEYYKEEKTNYFGTQDPQLSNQTVYKAIDAELKIVIRPFVAGDGNITLDIDVNQSDFTDRISEFAPPGKVTRQFKSMIRVADQETILLGGLEEKRKTEISRGIPFLSKVPILKWFFSSRVHDNVKKKMNILIKPTIIG